jgi:hypothetical protein
MKHHITIPCRKLAEYPAIAVLSLKILNGMTGSSATFHSTYIKAAHRINPKIIGIRILTEVHGADTPPEVTPTRSRVDPEIKSPRPR